MDIYQIVTDKIIEELNRGQIPWKKPWIGMDGAFNRVSKKTYSILNQLLLSKQGEYASFRQWKAMGGKIKKDAKSEMVVFWKICEVETEDENGEVTRKNLPFLRYHRVFHISDVEGVEPLEVQRFDTKPIEEVERVFQGYVKREEIEVSYIEGNRAFYSPISDKITLPCIYQFEKSAEFYSTAFHEASHSTMKKERCDREDDNKDSFFGNEEYSKEELVAEISSTYLMQKLGIATDDSFINNCGYIQSWLRVLENDKKFIVSAASRAEKAAKYILGE